MTASSPPAQSPADSAEVPASAGPRPFAPAAKPKVAPFVAKYEAFCYRALGDRLDRTREDPALATRLKQAGFYVTPGMYTALATLSTLIGAVVAFAFSLFLFWVVLQPALWWGYVLAITGVTGGSIYAGFISLISTRIANRKDQLDRELPFTLSELSVLASTGASPIRLLRRMAQRDHDPAMTGEFKRVMYKIDIQGKDLISALSESARESPSPSVRESFWDLANMIHQGGNLDEYLRSKSD